MSSLRVAVLQGGKSAEAEVSRNTESQVADALASKAHHPVLVELDPQMSPITPVEALLEVGADVVFPALHGPPGEDGTVQGYLEMLGLPYVGSGVRGSALAMDKAVAKTLFKQQNLPVAPDRLVPRNESHPKNVATQIISEFPHGLVIKPLNQGSAIGVTPLPNGGSPETVEKALIDALKFGDCLIEPFVSGKEITVGVLELGGVVTPHPVIEIVTANQQWYDYENRYTQGQSEHVIPAPLPEKTLASLQSIAITAHSCLGLRDLSRADFIVTDTNEIILLEVNTLPGMTPTSLYPDGARALGYSFAELLDALVMQAAQRNQS